MTPDPLAETIAQVAREAPEDVFDGMLDALRAEGETSLATVRWHLDEVAAAARLRQWTQRLLDGWSRRPDVGGGGLALALSAARKAARSQEGSVDLVWTGPASARFPVRRTDQVLLSLIEGARQELLIVSFAVHAEPRWLQALSRAVRRGVSVTLVLETTASGRIARDGVRMLDAAVGQGVRVLTWDPAGRLQNTAGRVGAIHAKCAVADRSAALVSSANLTEDALTLNLELGMAINGGPLPAKIAALFHDLVDQGHLIGVTQA